MDALVSSGNMGSESACSVTDSVTAAGTLLGLAIGAVLLVDWGNFKPRGKFGVLLARYVIGLIGLLALYLGLSAIFPRGQTLMAYVLRYIRYAALGFWVAYLAPRVFDWLRLNE